jgi:hypothetical protein
MAACRTAHNHNMDTAGTAGTVDTADTADTAEMAEMADMADTVAMERHARDSSHTRIPSCVADARSDGDVRVDDGPRVADARLLHESRASVNRARVGDPRILRRACDAA